MFGWTVHWKGYVPAGRAGTWYCFVATPGKMSPLNLTAPVESLISTLCGVDASWLSKSMTNGVSAGAVTCGVVNAMPDAVILTADPVSPEAAGDPEAAGEPEAAGAPDGAAPDAAGEPDGAAPDAAGEPEGVANSVVQQAGYGVAPGAG